jgi:predicted Zn-dependent peptidase
MLHIMNATLVQLVAAIIAFGPMASEASGSQDTTTVADTTSVADTTTIAPAETTTDTSPDNPFAGFETSFLSNGVKLWFKRLPGAPNVSVSVGIPYGADDDPEGLEEIAHFTEHMLFSDHRGMTEKEIKEVIEGVGGVRNAFTTSDHTWYYVTIAREHGLMALEWLARLVEPHAMDPAVVDRTREPVALEINARPRGLAEYTLALLDPSWLRLPDLWSREFGMSTRSARHYDRWARLQAITPDDLKAFYKTHYVPSMMTVTVVGDLNREEVLALAQSAFGGLQPGAATVGAPETRDPGRSRATNAWAFRSNVSLDQRVKLFNPNAQGLLHLEFMSDLLRRRLNQRLRYGETKAVYGISASLIQRGPATILQIRGAIDEEDWDFARGVIEEEMQSLRSGGLSTEDFEADRRALVERLRSDTNTAEALNRWSFRRFYDPEVFRDFPDLLGFYQTVTQAEIAQFASSVLLDERTTTRSVHVMPVTQAALLAVVVLFLWLTFKLTGWALTKPVAMTELRYMARFRVPPLLAATRFLVATGVALGLGRFIFFGFQWMTYQWVEPLDVFWMQASAYAGMGLVGVLAALLYLSRIPRKLLIFPDHIRIKALAFRSRILVPEEIAEVSMQRMPSVWFKKSILRNSLMTFGLIKPGIYLRPHKGRGYFFRVRKTDELMALLQGWWGGGGDQPEVTSEPDPPAPTDPPPADPPEDPLDIDSLDIDDPELEALMRANP